jgi:hypothetical protein
VRQLRGTAPAQVPDVEVSVGHGVGGMFAAGDARADEPRAHVSSQDNEENQL